MTRREITPMRTIRSDRTRPSDEGLCGGLCEPRQGPEFRAAVSPSCPNRTSQCGRHL